MCLRGSPRAYPCAGAGGRCVCPVRCPVSEPFSWCQEPCPGPQWPCVVVPVITVSLAAARCYRLGRRLCSAPSFGPSLERCPTPPQWGSQGHRRASRCPETLSPPTCFRVHLPRTLPFLWQLPTLQRVSGNLCPEPWREGTDGSVPSSEVRTGPWGQSGRGPTATHSPGALVDVTSLISSPSEAAITEFVQRTWFVQRVKAWLEVMPCEPLD